MSDRLAAHRFDLGCHLFARLELAAGDEDVGAVRGKGLDHLVAQAAAAAGDQRHLARQVEKVSHAATQDV